MVLLDLIIEPAATPMAGEAPQLPVPLHLSQCAGVAVEPVGHDGARVAGSWLNAVEGFFAMLTKRRLRRGSFASLVDLQAAINRYLKEANADPKPFVWTAEPDAIIE